MRAREAAVRMVDWSDESELGRKAAQQESAFLAKRIEETARRIDPAELAAVAMDAPREMEELRLAAEEPYHEESREEAVQELEKAKATDAPRASSPAHPGAVSMVIGQAAKRMGVSPEIYMRAAELAGLPAHRIAEESVQTPATTRPEAQSDARARHTEEMFLERKAAGGMPEAQEELAARTKKELDEQKRRAREEQESASLRIAAEAPGATGLEARRKLAEASAVAMMDDEAGFHELPPTAVTGTLGVFDVSDIPEVARPGEPGYELALGIVRQMTEVIPPEKLYALEDMYLAEPSGHQAYLDSVTDEIEKTLPRDEGGGGEGRRVEAMKRAAKFIAAQKTVGGVSMPIFIHLGSEDDPQRNLGDALKPSLEIIGISSDGNNTIVRQESRLLYMFGLIDAVFQSPVTGAAFGPSGLGLGRGEGETKEREGRTVAPGADTQTHVAADMVWQSIRDGSIEGIANRDVFLYPAMKKAREHFGAAVTKGEDGMPVRAAGEVGWGVTWGIVGLAATIISPDALVGLARAGKLATMARKTVTGTAEARRADAVLRGVEARRFADPEMAKMRAALVAGRVDEAEEALNRSVQILEDAQRAEAALRAEKNRTSKAAHALDEVDRDIAAEIVEDFPDILNPYLARSLRSEPGVDPVPFSLHPSRQRAQRAVEPPKGSDMDKAEGEIGKVYDTAGQLKYLYNLRRQIAADPEAAVRVFRADAEAMIRAKDNPVRRSLGLDDAQIDAVVAATRMPAGAPRTQALASLTDSQRVLANVLDSAEALVRSGASPYDARRWRDNTIGLRRQITSLVEDAADADDVKDLKRDLRWRFITELVIPLSHAARNAPSTRNLDRALVSLAIANETRAAAAALLRKAYDAAYGIGVRFRRGPEGELPHLTERIQRELTRRIEALGQKRAPLAESAKIEDLVVEEAHARGDIRTREELLEELRTTGKVTLPKPGSKPSPGVPAPKRGVPSDESARHRVRNIRTLVSENPDGIHPEAMEKLVAEAKDAKDLATRIAAATKLPEHRLIAEKLAANLPEGIPVRADPKFPERGAFDPRVGPAGAITLRALDARGGDLSGLDEISVLHELTHAATWAALRTRSASPKVLAAQIDMENLAVAVRRALDDIRAGRGDWPAGARTLTGARYAETFAYYAKNRDELLAGTFSDPEFRELLRLIPYRTGATGQLRLWDRFLELVSDLLGIPLGHQTALGAILDRGTRLMEAGAKAEDVRVAAQVDDVPAPPRSESVGGEGTQHRARNIRTLVSENPDGIHPEAMEKLIHANDDARDLAARIAKVSKLPEHRLIAQKIADVLRPDIPVRIDDHLQPSGLYHPGVGDDGAITLRGLDAEDYTGIDEMTVLHELTHAATWAALHVERATPELRAVQRELEHIHRVVSDAITDMQRRDARFGPRVADHEVPVDWSESTRALAEARWRQFAYYDTNVDELLAGVFSDPEFRELLKAIRVEPKFSPVRLWDRFLKLIGDLLGIPTNHQTALGAILDHGTRLMDAGVRASDVKLRPSVDMFHEGAVFAPPRGNANFDRWFGASKVVDEDGRPRVVYHGTRSEFKAFDPARANPAGLHGPGFYFTEHPALASDYASNFASSTSARAGPSVIPVMLRVERPFDMDGPLTVEAAEEIGRVIADDHARRLFLRSVVGSSPVPPTGRMGWRALVEAIGTDKEAANNVLSLAGYDGLTYAVRAEDGIPATRAWVVFEPTQIKSPFNRGAYSPTDPAILRAPERHVQRGGSIDEPLPPGFYSQLRRQVEAWPDDRITKGQLPKFFSTLASRGVKAEEVEWTRVREFLADKPSVTKQELLGWLDENAVVVEERTLGGPAQQRLMDDVVRAQASLTEALIADLRRGGHDTSPAGISRARDQLEDGSLLDEPGFDRTFVAFEMVNRATEALGDAGTAGRTQYHTYVLPGGTNYRELLFKLPRANELGTEYTTPHFVGDKNLLLHVRMNDRVGPDGERLLHVEEVQSDWHQAGREKGYTPGAEERARLEQTRDMAARRLDDLLEKEDNLGFDTKREARAAIASEGVDNFEVSPELREAAETYRRAIIELGTPALSGRPPPAPFAETWHQLAMKRVLRIAAEEGYDGVTWTTGVQQVRRYEDATRQVVDEVRWFVPAKPLSESEAAYRKLGMNGIRRELNLMQTEENAGRAVDEARRAELTAAFDDIYDAPLRSSRAGTRVVEAHKGHRLVFRAEVHPDGTLVEPVGNSRTLHDVFGKEMAKRIVQSQDAAGTLKGDDLTIGGEGMKGFYDRMLPDWVGAYVKKLGGGRVDATQIHLKEDPLDEAMRMVETRGRGVSSGTTETVHHVAITPEMRRSLLEGQPLFAPKRGPKTPATRTDIPKPVRAALARNDTFTPEDLSALQSALDAERAMRSGDPLRPAIGASQEAIDEPDASRVLQQWAEGKGVRPFIATVAAVLLLGGDADRMLKILPPAVRDGTKRTLRLIHQGINDVVRLMGDTKPGDDGWDGLVRYVTGENIVFRDGSAVPSSGYDMAGAVRDRLRAWFDALDVATKRKLLSVRSIDELKRIEVDPTEVEVEALAILLHSPNSPKFLQRMPEMISPHLARGQAKQGADIRFARALLDFMGVFDDVPIAESTRRFLDSTRRVYGETETGRLLAALAAHGQSERGMADWVMNGLAINSREMQRFKQYIAGEYLDAMHLPRMREIARRFGLDPDWVAVPDSDLIYVPQAVRGRMEAGLLGVEDIKDIEALAAKKMKSDDWHRRVFGALLRFRKNRMIIGNVFLRQRYFWTNTLDHFDQMALVTRFGIAAGSTARVAFQNPIVVPFLARGAWVVGTIRAGLAPVAEGAARMLAADPETIRMISAIMRDEKAIERWRRRLQTMGDAIGRFLSRAKYRVETNAVLEGAPGFVNLGGRVYTYADLRKLAIENGVFNTFPSSELEAAVSRVVKDGLGRLDVVQGTPGRVVRWGQEVTRLPREIATAWSERERVGAFVTLLESGFDASTAGVIVTRALFDYAGTMTKADRHVIVQLLLPFWAYQKNANRLILDAIFSPRAAYRMGVLRRARQYGPHAVAMMWYDHVVEPYGIDIDHLPPETREMYWRIREEVEVHYGGYTKVPPEVKRAVAALMAGQASWKERGRISTLDVELVKLVNQTDLLTRKAAVPEPDPASRRTWVRSRGGGAITFDQIEAVQDYMTHAEAFGYSPTLEVIPPESTIQSAFRHASALAATVILAGNTVFGDDESAADLMSWHNPLLDISDPERAPFIGEVLGEVTEQQGPPLKVHPWVMSLIETTTSIPPDGEPVPLAATLKNMAGSGLTRALSFGRLHRGMRAEYHPAKVDPRAPEGTPPVTLPYYTLPPGMWTSAFLDSPLGELNRHAWEFTETPLEQAAGMQGELVRWARVLTGVQLVETDSQRAADAERPREVVEMANAPPPVR